MSHPRVIAILDNRRLTPKKTYGKLGFFTVTKKSEIDMRPYHQLLERYITDREFWVNLAKKYNQHLPAYGPRATEKKMRQWLKKLYITEKEFLCAIGYKALSDFNEITVNFPLRVFFGMLLEYISARDNTRYILKKYKDMRKEKWYE